MAALTVNFGLHFAFIIFMHYTTQLIFTIHSATVRTDTYPTATVNLSTPILLRARTHTHSLYTYEY